MLTLLNSVQYENALFSMVVTLSGMLTLFREAQ